MLKAIGRLLASDGFASEQFSDPVKFLAYARTHSIELAVLDIRMPVIGGLAVQSALRTACPDVQVIVITAEEDPSHRLAALANGAAAFFLKPFNDEPFLAAVRSIVGKPGGPVV